MGRATVVVLMLAAVMLLALPARATTDTWTFGEPAGSSTVTSTGGHVGDLQDQGSTTGVYVEGGRLHLKGHGRVVVPNDPSLNPYAQPFSISVEVRTGQVPSGSVGDFDLLRKGLATDKRYWKLELYPNSSNTQAFALCQMRGRNDALGVFVGVRLKWTGRNLADGRWHTIACSKTDSTVTLSVDGVVRMSKSGALGSVYNAADMSIGAKAEVWEDMTRGDLDDASYRIG